MRGVVVADGMGVEEFAGVVGAVACGLEPEGEVVCVEALGDEFGVAACFALVEILVVRGMRTGRRKRKEAYHRED